MNAGIGFKWTAPPSVIAVGLTKYVRSLIAAIGRLAGEFSAKILTYARSIAPWNDQTGNARALLQARLIRSATAVTIVLAHGVAYGIFLELGHYTRNRVTFVQALPAILPALEAHYGAIMAAIRALMR